MVLGIGITWDSDYFEWFLKPVTHWILVELYQTFTLLTVGAWKGSARTQLYDSRNRHEMQEPRGKCWQKLGDPEFSDFLGGRGQAATASHRGIGGLLCVGLSSQPSRVWFLGPYLFFFKKNWQLLETLKPLINSMFVLVQLPCGLYSLWLFLSR